MARTLLLSSVGPKAAGKRISSAARMAIRFYVRAYQNRYQALSPETPKEAGRWMPVIAAARLNENIAPEREALIEIVKKATG